MAPNFNHFPRRLDRGRYRLFPVDCCELRESLVTVNWEAFAMGGGGSWYIPPTATGKRRYSRRRGNPVVGGMNTKNAYRVWQGWNKVVGCMDTLRPEMYTWNLFMYLGYLSVCKRRGHLGISCEYPRGPPLTFRIKWEIFRIRFHIRQTHGSLTKQPARAVADAQTQGRAEPMSPLRQQ